MSFLFGGAARPQPSSAEKIAAAEAEIEMVSNMFNQSVLSPSSYTTLLIPH
jgi:mitochondrial import inner membrane translocase subunit TIM10